MNDLTNKTTAGKQAWLAALAVVAGMAMPSANAIQLSVQPGFINVAPGAGVDVSLVISGLGDGVAPALGAFDLNLAFDTSVLTYDSVTFGDSGLGNQLALNVPSVDGDSFDAGLGVLNLFSVSLDSVSDLESLQAGSFVLASLHFTASGLGLSGLTLSDIILSDAVGADLIADTIRGGSVEVTRGTATVPDAGMVFPGVFLLAFGAGCSWIRQRRGQG